MEARAIAELIVEPLAKENMLRVAEAYEEMAKSAEQRKLTGKPSLAFRLVR